MTAADDKCGYAKYVSAAIARSGIPLSHKQELARQIATEQGFATPNEEDVFIKICMESLANFTETDLAPDGG
jgi:hypothetical protein